MVGSGIIIPEDEHIFAHTHIHTYIYIYNIIYIRPSLGMTQTTVSLAQKIKAIPSAKFPDSLHRQQVSHNQDLA